MATSKGARILRPLYILPNTPEYWHPSINNNPLSAPIVMMLLATFTICTLSSLSPMVCAWAKPTVRVAAALKQTYEAWKSLQGEHKKVAAVPAEYTLNNGKQQFCQPWLEKNEVEICMELKNLLNPHIALQGYFYEVFHEVVVKAPHNIATTLVDPGTIVTGITLTPSAVLSHLGSSATDPTMVLVWNTLSGIAAIGIPGTSIGLTNQATWQWILQKATWNAGTLRMLTRLETWSRDTLRCWPTIPRIGYLALLKMFLARWLPYGKLFGCSFSSCAIQVDSCWTCVNA